MLQFAGLSAILSSFVGVLRHVSKDGAKTSAINDRVERRKKKMRTRIIWAAAIASSGILLLATRDVVRADHDDDEEKYLFVWAEDQARTNPDFLTFSIQ